MINLAERDRGVVFFKHSLWPFKKALSSLIAPDARLVKRFVFMDMITSRCRHLVHLNYGTKAPKDLQGRC